MPQYFHAASRQLHAREILLQKINAEEQLQPLHLRADGRLREIVELSRLGETAELMNGHEGSQQIRWDIDLVDYGGGFMARVLAIMSLRIVMRTGSSH
jgi:hypothetical protein